MDRPFPALRCSVLRFLPLLAGVLLACAWGCSKRPQATPLSPRAPVTRDLAPGGSHEYALRLESGQYLEIRLEQPGIDVDARLAGPENAQVAVVDDPAALDPERLALIASAAGEYRLTVSPHDPKARPGRYRVELRVLRPAGPGDSERATAAQAFAMGRRYLAKSRTGPPAQLEENERKALSSFERARGLSRAAGDPEGEADALFEIGDLRMGDDDPRPAVAAYEAAAALARGLGDDRRLGRVLQSLGFLALIRHQTGDALALLSEALSLRRRAGDRIGVARTLINLHGVYYARGEVGRAFALLREAEGLTGWNKQLRAAVHQSRGQIYKLRGQPWKALEEFQQSVLTLNPVDPDRYTALEAVGTAYLDLGDTKQALAYYRRALAFAVSRETRESQARAHALIGWTLRGQGDREQALTEYDQAEALLPAKPKVNVEIPILRFKGLTEAELGRREEALGPLQRVLELSAQSPPDRLARAHLELGGVLRDLGRDGEAARHFETALDLARQVEGADLQAACLYQWARLERRQGRLESALGKIREALAIVESVRSNVSDQGLRATFFASKRDYYELAIDLLLQLHEREPQANFQRQAFEASEHARARGLLDLLAELRVDLRHESPSGLLRREADLEDRLAWIGEQLRGKGADLVSLRRDLTATQEALAGLREEIRQRDPAYAEARYPKPLSLPEVQSLLDGETALLQYFLGTDEAFLFVVTREGLESYRLGSPETLRLRVSELRSVLGSKETMLSFRHYGELASDLYRRLLAPAQPALASKPHLLIAPDDALYLLPFEALPVPSAGAAARGYADVRYLLEAYDEVTYVPSASVLAGLRADRPEAATSLVAFAYPVEEQRSAGEPGRATDGRAASLQLLPYSRKEVEGIAQLYPPASIVLRIGETATEGEAKSLLRRGGQRIHFASHGFVNEAQPWRSGLQLAGDAHDDGLFEVDEIFHMKMSCDLLVLSACNTGLGGQVRGEGLIGLTRAFLHAGARSLVVSLWQVSDRSTAELMVDFYSHLGSAGTKAEALRQAKLDMIHKGKQYSAPYRWAPFVLIGEPR